MANLRAIRTRIKSVENTRQITKSMKMVAAAKLRRTQGAFATLCQFAEESGNLLRAASAGSALTSENPCLQVHEAVQKISFVLLVGNRGLCGTYNQVLLRYCEKLAAERRAETGKTPEISLIVCGRWGRDLIAASGIPIRDTVDISDTPTREEAVSLTEKLKQLYRNGEVDEVILVYQQYRSVLSQTPCSRTLLPLQAEHESETPSADGNESTGDIIFEPDRESIVNALLDMYLTNSVHAALLEARTGEHSARMTAMTAASDNTEELISKLTLELNHARQAAITTEITEIASGAEALRNLQPGG